MNLMPGRAFHIILFISSQSAMSLLRKPMKTANVRKCPQKNRYNSVSFAPDMMRIGIPNSLSIGNMFRLLPDRIWLYLRFFYFWEKFSKTAISPRKPILFFCKAPHSKALFALYYIPS